LIVIEEVIYDRHLSPEVAVSLYENGRSRSPRRVVTEALEGSSELKKIAQRMEKRPTDVKNIRWSFFYPLAILNSRSDIQPFADLRPSRGLTAKFR
jgi:hypothetical protein